MSVQQFAVPVEPMTPESFAPYGTVFGDGAMSDVRDDRQLPFSHVGAVTLGTMAQPYGEQTFHRLERHFDVTQAFVQLSGTASVVCVAPASDISERKVVPAPETVRGFLIDRDLGFQYHVGTWHSLDRFVLSPPGATFLIVNVSPNPTQIVDYLSGAIEMHDDLGTTAPQISGQSPYRNIRFSLAL